MIDIGCGSGTTVLELAARVGPAVMCGGRHLKTVGGKGARTHCRCWHSQAEIVLCDVSTQHLAPETALIGVLAFRRHVLRRTNRTSRTPKAINPTGRLAMAVFRTRKKMVGNSTNGRSPSHVATPHTARTGGAGQFSWADPAASTAFWKVPASGKFLDTI